MTATAFTLILVLLAALIYKAHHARAYRLAYESVASRLDRANLADRLLAAHSPTAEVKTRQRSNTAQGEPHYAMVEGVADRNGDGRPDRPPPIAEVLADVYDDAPDASTVESADELTLAELLAARLFEFDGRREVFASPRDYKNAVRGLARQLEREAARRLSVEHLLDLARERELERDRLASELDTAQAALREANDSMLKTICANSVASDPTTRRLAFSTIAADGSRSLRCVDESGIYGDAEHARAVEVLSRQRARELPDAPVTPPFDDEEVLTGGARP